VARDVRDELLDVAAARSDYGVVLGADKLEVDEEATLRVRSERTVSMRQRNTRRSARLTHDTSQDT
jgi:hypothetical protein